MSDSMGSGLRGLYRMVRFFHDNAIQHCNFVPSVTKKDWEWLLNTLVYGQLFPKASDAEKESLKRLGRRWKVRSHTTTVSSC